MAIARQLSKSMLRPSVGVINRALALAIVFGLTVVASPKAQAQTYQVIHTFTGGGDGAAPQAGVTLDAAGNLYGTTYSGGAGYGTVYRLKRSGSNWLLNPLYTFAGGSDGANPTANIVSGPNGLRYGTTYDGGGSGCSGSGCGTVFSLRPSASAPRSVLAPWTETVLYRFSGGADGEHPAGNLVFDAAGNAYGTTYGNPATSSYGTVFKITPGGMFSTLYSFCSQSNCADGAAPYAGLVKGTDENFYGTTEAGGTSNACEDYPAGCGTVFKITPSGTLTTLYSFCSLANCADGELPTAGLIQATDGNFYGTTYTGTPTSPSYGVAFKITPTGTLSVIYSFCSQRNCTDGAAPFAALFQASDGNFYGTTKFGGVNDACVEGGSEVACGTLFKLTPGGDLTTLYSFCPQSGCPDGQWPLASLVQDPLTGNFYGTASYGGVGNGTAFSLDVGLGLVADRVSQRVVKPAVSHNR